MSTNSSKLDMILGPMFSGKTTKLLEIMDAFDKQGIKYIAVKPNIDNRYNDSDKNNFIVSILILKVYHLVENGNNIVS